jgi:HK97 family phage major capsid protein
VEQKELIQTLDSIKSEIEKTSDLKIQAVKDNAQREAKEFSDKIAELKAAAAEQQKHLDELTARQKDIKVGAESTKSFEEKVYDQLKANEARFKSMLESGDGGKVSIKAAATMTRSNYSGGTVGLSSWDSAFALVPRRAPRLRQIVNSFSVDNQYVAWAEQANRDGGAGQTAEGAAKTQADFDIVEANKKVEKITAYTKVSKEALADIKFLNREINNDLVSLIELKLDTDLYSGSGTTPAIKGIKEYATAFSVAGSVLALGIDNANELDVLRAAMWQIENAYFSPNYICLNPVDVAKIDMLKSTTNEYLTHQAAGQFMFKAFYGLPIVSSNVITAGDFLIGDFSKSNLGIREDINIAVGFDSDDFTKNLVTILAEMRAVHYIKSNHTAAFVKGTFSTAKTALETA